MCRVLISTILGINETHKDKITWLFLTTDECSGINNNQIKKKQKDREIKTKKTKLNSALLQKHWETGMVKLIIRIY